MVPGQPAALSCPQEADGRRTLHLLPDMIALDSGLLRPVKRGYRAWMNYPPSLSPRGPAKLSIAQRAYVTNDPRWPEHQRQP
jgi:hypothetical protein